MYSSSPPKQSLQMDQILSYPAPPIGVNYGQQPPPNLGYGQPSLNQPHPAPVVQQPATNFYPAPMAPQQVPFGPYSNPAVPRGLEDLLTLDQLIVEQQVEMLEAFLGYETNNKYIVKDLNGRHLFYVAEENDCCTRNCMGKDRPFVIKVYDAYRNEILRFDRPFRCTSCLYPCCLQEMDIYGNGQKLGSIEQEWSLFVPEFAVLNAADEKVLHIEGPMCAFSCFGSDVEFNIQSVDRTTEVGKITKQWSGLAREMFTDADRFGMKFPRDLDVNIKVVLLGALFLIDFMYFERSHNS